MQTAAKQAAFFARKLQKLRRRITYERGGGGGGGGIRVFGFTVLVIFKICFSVFVSVVTFFFVNIRFSVFMNKKSGFRIWFNFAS